MAGSGFRTTVETMQAAANNAEQVSADVASELSALRGRIDPLFSVFKGQAATAYMNTQAKWETAAKQLTDALNDIAVGIRQNAGTYQSQDEQQSQSLGQIGNALG